MESKRVNAINAPAATPASIYSSAGQSDSNAAEQRAPGMAIPLQPLVLALGEMERRLDGHPLRLRSGDNAFVGRLISVAIREDAVMSAADPANLGPKDFVALVHSRSESKDPGLRRSSEGKSRYLVRADLLEPTGDSSSAPVLPPRSDGEPRR
jgi:hypothetical protein